MSGMIRQELSGEVAKLEYSSKNKECSEEDGEEDMDG